LLTGFSTDNDKPANPLPATINKSSITNNHRALIKHLFIFIGEHLILSTDNYTF
jgi:hypothetical protein